MLWIQIWSALMILVTQTQFVINFYIHPTTLPNLVIKLSKVHLKTQVYLIFVCFCRNSVGNRTWSPLQNELILKFIHCFRMLFGCVLSFSQYIQIRRKRSICIISFQKGLITVLIKWFYNIKQCKIGTLDILRCMLRIYCKITRIQIEGFFAYRNLRAQVPTYIL